MNLKGSTKSNSGVAACNLMPSSHLLPQKVSAGSRYSQAHEQENSARSWRPPQRGKKDKVFQFQGDSLLNFYEKKMVFLIGKNIYFSRVKSPNCRWSFDGKQRAWLCLFFMKVKYQVSFLGSFHFKVPTTIDLNNRDMYVLIQQWRVLS